MNQYTRAVIPAAIMEGSVGEVAQLGSRGVCAGLCSPASRMRRLEFIFRGGECGTDLRRLFARASLGNLVPLAIWFGNRPPSETEQQSYLETVAWHAPEYCVALALVRRGESR